MSLHKRHAVGKVFKGHAARQHLAMHKRDSHSDALRMHVPEGFGEKQKADDTNGDGSGSDQQAVSVVYVTLSQTFSGPAIYSTLGSTPTGDVQQPAATDAEASYDAAKSAANHKTAASATSIATVTPDKGSEVTPMSTLATSFAGAGLAASSSVANVAVGTPIHNSHASSTSSASQGIAQESSGMTGGAKAGLAIGIILAIALAAGLIFFCWRRKKQTQHQEEMLNEKHGSFVDAGARRVEAGGSRDSSFMARGADISNKRDSNMTEKVPSSLRSTRTASTAPRLSLRPVTQFLPILGENAKGNGSNLDVSSAQKSSGAQQNPFADASETQARPSTPPQNPFDEPEGKKSVDSRGSTGSAGVAAAAAAAVASKKHSPKSSWEGSEPPTPKSTKFGTAAAVPVGAAGPRDPPPPRGPNNVHRVQLDFKPSMDDELELVSGQLVRMLHEYDDGWALCIRMDRSQQGVAPRTCLSKLPVKPRPQGPPPPGSRPGTAQGPRRPSNPPAPSGSMMNGAAMIPRPLTPTQAPPKRSSGSGSLPSGSGKIERKPVPGQAI